MKKIRKKPVKWPRLMLAAALGTTLAWPVGAMAAHLPFSSSFDDVSNRNNDYWTIYGVAEGTAEVNGERFAGNNPAWFEWDALKFAWTGYKGYRTTARDTLRRSTSTG